MVAKFRGQGQDFTAFVALEGQFLSALQAELGIFSVFMLAFRAFHDAY
jgi:hypothetical protein